MGRPRRLRCTKSRGPRGERSLPAARSGRLGPRYLSYFLAFLARAGAYWSDVARLFLIRCAHLEHIIRNEGVGSSSLSCGTNKINDLGLDSTEDASQSSSGKRMGSKLALVGTLMAPHRRCP